MSVCANLIDVYNNELMSLANVRSLMGAVPQNPQDETIDMEAARFALKEHLDNLGGVQTLGEERRAIIAFLNKLYFSSLEVNIPGSWYWEMHTRLQKLLVVSMVLEGCNLRSFGVETLERSDIPQCLVRIFTLLRTKRQAFETLRKHYLEDCDNLAESGKQGSDFLQLYLAQ